MVTNRVFFIKKTAFAAFGAAILLVLCIIFFPSNAFIALTERGLIFLSCLLTIAAFLTNNLRAILLKFNFALLIFLCLALSLHLSLDHFQYRYVWLYSAPDLKLYLKISNLWGGEEGTVLFLAALLSYFSFRLRNHSIWTVRGIILLTFPFVIGLIFWHPFTLTTAQQFAHAPYQGVNAHLTKFWMAIHPPLIFITYAMLLVPAGAALEAMIKGRGTWKELALKYSRGAWVILSAGLISGMWWAYEDYFYGSFWHWDPVQTASFVVWCFLTAYLHGLRGYNPEGAYARILPFLALLTAAAAIGSMLVSRSGVLASSHQYIGSTSLMLFSFISLSLFIIALGGLIISQVIARKKPAPQESDLTQKFTLNPRSKLSPESTLSSTSKLAPKLKLTPTSKPTPKPRLTESRLMIWISIWGFFILGLIGCYFIAEAYLRAFFEIDKDKMPIFFSLIQGVSSSDFMQYLTSQNLHWTVDNFALNQMAVPAIFIIALIGGQKFLPFPSFKLRFLSSVIAIILCIILAHYIKPLERIYSGTGLTSSKTRDNFYALNMLLGMIGYFTLASFLYILPRNIMGASDKTYFKYRAPVGLIHMGVMIGLFSALCASILDQNIIKKITLPDEYDTKIYLSDTHSITVTKPKALMSRPDHYKAVSQIKLTLSNRGEDIFKYGQSLYQDNRKTLSGDFGAIRQYCEAIDYRFARASRDNHHMIHPYIYRSLAYDLQIWLPAAPAPKSSLLEESKEYYIIVKKFPMMTFLWLGLCLSLAAGLFYAIFSKSKSLGRIK